MRNHITARLRLVIGGVGLTIALWYLWLVRNEGALLTALNEITQEMGLP